MHLISASVGLLLLITALSTHRDLLAQESVEQSAFLNRWTEALESVSQRVAPSVVRIFVSRRLLPLIVGGSSSSLTREHSSGSGVIVSEDGYVVTNAHVVQNARRIQLLMTSTLDQTAPRKSILKPSGSLIPASIVGIDLETDLAVLQMEEEKLPFLQFNDSDELRQGQIVLAFGSPLGLENSVSLGVVSSVRPNTRPGAPASRPSCRARCVCLAARPCGASPPADARGRPIGRREAHVIAQHRRLQSSSSPAGNGCLAKHGEGRRKPLGKPASGSSFV